MRRILPIFLYIGIIFCSGLGETEEKKESIEHGSKKEGSPEEVVPNPSITYPSSGGPGGIEYKTQSSSTGNNFKQYENNPEKNEGPNLKPAPTFLRLVPLRQTKSFNPRIQTGGPGFFPVQTFPIPIQFVHESQISDARQSVSPISKQSANFGFSLERREQSYIPPQSKRPYLRPVTNAFFRQSRLSFGNQNLPSPLYYSLNPFLQTNTISLGAANTLPGQIVFNEEQNTIKTSLPGLQVFRNTNNLYTPNGNKQPNLKPVPFSYQVLSPFNQPEQEVLDEYSFSNFNIQKQTRPYSIVPLIKTLPNPFEFPEELSTLPAPKPSIYSPQLVVLSHSLTDDQQDPSAEDEYGGLIDEETKTNYTPRGSNIVFEDSQNIAEGKTMSNFGGTKGEDVETRQTSGSGFNPGRVDTRPSFPPGFNAGRNSLRGIVLDDEMVESVPKISLNFGETAPKTFIYVA